ncbi:hypothetical protein IPG36_07815 [bacterium]|nr:MAG: hypothetical protein IPG36_07815 [bacterium]
MVPANDLLKYNLKSLLVWLRNTLAEAVYYPRDYLRLATNRPELVWSGHLADPVPALRQLKNLVGVGSIGDVIDDLNRVNRLAKANAGEYRDAIRRMQVELREAEASLGAARRILTNQVEVDVEEARQELAIITAMPGVIAVHFVDGYLELHVRNSAVYRERGTTWVTSP